MYRVSLAFICCLVLLTASCSWIYIPDVRQGNYVDQNLISQLRPGMSKDQVRFLLGTPLLTDPFRQDRWDYVYRFQPGDGSEIEQQRVSLFFQGDSLNRVEPSAGL